MELKSLQYGDYSAVINLSLGANCISLRNRRYGVRLLREPDYKKGELDNPYLYGMPILFPVNRISGGRFFFDGREYRFPVNEPSTGCHLHGLIHMQRFEVLEESGARVLCAYRNDGSLYPSFPHAFEIRIEYTLGDDGLTQVTEVFNHSAKRMPCLLGFHTTFCIDFCGEGEVLAGAKIAKEFERNMRVYLPTGRTPVFDEVSRALEEGRFSPVSQPISRHYRAGDNGVMTLFNRDRGVRILYENDPQYAFRLIYNGNANEYICMEPQTCLANAPNAPFDRAESGFDSIEPHASKIYTSKIYIVKEDILS